jgi:hypothetical protein
MHTVCKTIIITILTTVCAQFAYVASADAEIKESFWKVNGSTLEPGTNTREYVILKTITPIVIKGTVNGAKLEVECPEVQTEGNVSEPVEIRGGKPGSNQEKYKFVKCKLLSPEPTNCELAFGTTLRTAFLESEIVEYADPEANGPVLLFRVKTAGKDFLENAIEIKDIEGKTCKSAVNWGCPFMSGSVIGGPSNASSEAVKPSVSFFPTPTFGYVKENKEKLRAELTLAGNTAELTGKFEIELKSKESFGAFIA